MDIIPLLLGSGGNGFIVLIYLTTYKCGSTEGGLDQRDLFVVPHTGIQLAI